MTKSPSSKPLILDLSSKEDLATFSELEATQRIHHKVDTYIAQLQELYAINNPSRIYDPNFSASRDQYVASIPDVDHHGRWVYFPWSCTAVHILEDVAFQKVRTARNKYLISEVEQQKYYDAVIGIAGLSVGSSVGLAIVLSGGSRRMKLADHDTLDLSNLNRIRAGVPALGLPKVEMTARQIYELNPYAELELYPEGLTDENMDAFFSDLDIVVDEIDALAMKYRIREEAKKRKLPLLSAADNDRMGVVDIERYDLDSPPEPFHGKLPGATVGSLGKLDKLGIGKTIATLIGLENHTPRMLTSLSEMGKSTVSWPQLGVTALLNGSLVAYAALRIANDQSLIADRVIVAMDALLDGDYNDKQVANERKVAIQNFKTLFNL